MKLTAPQMCELKFHEDNDYIWKRKHPTKDLWVYKYSKVWEIIARKNATTNREYLESWSELQRMMRGVVLTADGKVVSRPFRKFFNIEDHNYEVPDGPFTVFEKLDGSAIVISRYQNELIINTLGSFESDQAIYAEHLLFERYGHLVKHFEEGYTYVFEILYSDNQIVVKYEGDPKLVLLAIVNNETGEERSIAEHVWPDKPKVYDFDSIDQIVKHLKRPEFMNEEGYVVYFHSTKTRVKFKFQRYFEIHRIRSNLTPKAIWELLRNKQTLTDIADLPDEFIQEIEAIQNDLLAQYQKIERQAKHHFSLGQELLSVSRKDYALWAKSKERSEWTSILFSMADGKDYSKTIWDMIKPTQEKELPDE